MRLRQEASFHAEAGGTRLGVLDGGQVFPVLRSSRGWREILLEGWIWTGSLAPTTRDGFNVVISLNQGENLRLEPNGDRLGFALEGALFNRIRRQGGWTRVNRRVWVSSGVFAPSGGNPSRPAPNPDAPSPATELPAPSGQSADTLASSAPARREPVDVQAGATLYGGPGIDTLGRTSAPMRGEVLERSAGWIRVRAEAWVREGDVTPAPLRGDDAISLEQLRQDPERYVGRPVVWRLQYLSVRQADELRPEIPAGSEYVTARGPLPEVGFVYLIVTRQQADQIRHMAPLTEFLVEGTIVAPRTRHLLTPVIRLERLP